MIKGLSAKMVGLVTAVLSLTSFNPQERPVKEITELNLTAIQDGDCTNDALICQLHFSGKFTMDKVPASDTVRVDLYINRQHTDTRLIPTNKNGDFKFDWSANLREGIHKFIVCPNKQLTKCKVRDIFGA